MIKKCENGHWYDAGIQKTCPHCLQESEKLGIGLYDIREDDRTVSIAEAGVSLGKELDAVIEQSKDLSGPFDTAQESEADKTVSFGFWGADDERPVTGWLVCLTGEGRGKDYRLHSGKNFIGRSPSMDIVLADDKKISRKKHVSVVYDPKGNAFYLSAEGGNLVYLNGELLESIKELKEDDRFTIGDTTLVFIPFCRGKRTWDESGDL